MQHPISKQRPGLSRRFVASPARSTVDTRQSKARGFTIVELLIVIVVIAILAAITIVAYNGIQSRAVAA
jgi:prepilin-type N-terminal cleavage/methylation domain-containing protein